LIDALPVSDRYLEKDFSVAAAFAFALNDPTSGLEHVERCLHLLRASDMTETLLDGLHEPCHARPTISLEFADAEQVDQDDPVLVRHWLHPYARGEVMLVFGELHDAPSIVTG